MKAVFFVLNDSTLLPKLLKELNSLNINGGTIFQSNGMGRELAKDGDYKITGFLRSLLNPELTSTNTLLFVLEEERIPTLLTGIKNVVGDLSKPNTGILFSIPVDFVEGLKI